jgi:hypothetical protein
MRRNERDGDPKARRAKGRQKNYMRGVRRYGIYHGGSHRRRPRRARLPGSRPDWRLTGWGRKRSGKGLFQKGPSPLLALTVLSFLASSPACGAGSRTWSGVRRGMSAWESRDADAAVALVVRRARRCRLFFLARRIRERPLELRRIYPEVDVIPANCRLPARKSRLGR